MATPTWHSNPEEPSPSNVLKALAAFCILLVAVDVAIFVREPRLGLRRIAVVIGVFSAITSFVLLVIVLGADGLNGQMAALIAELASAIGLAVSFVALLALAAHRWVVSGFDVDRARRALMEKES